jgi:hypothetical protein
MHKSLNKACIKEQVDQVLASSGDDKQVQRSLKSLN